MSNDPHDPPARQPAALKRAHARVATGETGAPIHLPALLTPDGVVASLLDYFAAKSQSRSRSWMDKVLRAVGLFVRYASTQPDGTDERALLRGFAECLHEGTLDDEGRDPSGLDWRRSSDAVAGYTITLLARFFEFLSAPDGPDAGEAVGRYDRLLAQCAFRYRRDKTCLRYSRPANEPARWIHVQGAQGSAPDDRRRPPAFPQDRLLALLFDGFKTGAKYDYRGMLITLLLNGAGFAAFEPFHLYVTDVVQDPLDKDKALLCIPHPFHGAGSGKDDAARRAEHLRTRWKAQQRAPARGHMASEPAPPGAGFRPVWRQPELGALFGRLWARYLPQLEDTKRDHPFAFINLRAGGHGKPYTIGQFNKAHATACQRIGLQVGRQFGTTLEGHRQAYEQQMRAARMAAQAA